MYALLLVLQEQLSDYGKSQIQQGLADTKTRKFDTRTQLDKLNLLSWQHTPELASPTATVGERVAMSYGNRKSNQNCSDPNHGPRVVWYV
jgi:hypothetical protein